MFPAARTRRIMPTPEWVEKISDLHLFDDGWNKLRDRFSPTRSGSA